MNLIIFIRLGFASFFVFSGLSTYSLASDVITGLDIKKAVIDRLANDGIVGKPHISERRRYYSCGTELKVTPKFDKNWDTARVSCPEVNKEWHILVRTGAVTTTEAPDTSDSEVKGLDVVVLLASVKRGAIITDDIVSLTPAPAGNRLGNFHRVEDVIGRRAKQGISAMQPLKARHLEHQWAVQSGQTVQIIQRLKGFEVSSVGKILADAQIGDIVAVMNSRSGKEISAFVESAKKVSPIANMN